MNNRNVIYFVIGSMILLGGQFWLSSRYPKAAPAAEAKVAAPAQPQATTPPATAATPVTSAAGPAAGATNVADAAATFTVANNELSLTWQVSTGALKQVVWRQDGTKFFPASFPGLAAFRGTGFEGVRQEEMGTRGTAVIFENASGERLSYLVPPRGHILQVEAASPRGAAVLLIANPSTEEPVKHLGRLFTLTDKGVDAVTWTEMLTDPFFSFLGSKRKILPPAAERLGLDAGLEKDEKNQRNHYFAALWKLSRPAATDAAGYLLVPQTGQPLGSLYLGPKRDEPLLAFEKPFTQVIDYGFFGAVAQGLFWILKKLHALVGNWGWAIILLTVLIKLVFFPLSAASYKSMARMKEVQPRLMVMKEQYKGEPQKLNQAMMEMYRKEKINPLGGCLPVVIQIPVFISLYWVLLSSVELRGAPWILWVHDLSLPDTSISDILGLTQFFPIGILPIVMAISMFVQTKLNPTPPDPIQAKIMMYMPIVFSIMFFFFPAGLVLYWVVNNLLSIAQQWQINVLFGKKTAK